jgi:hypothetical protein
MIVICKQKFYLFLSHYKNEKIDILKEKNPNQSFPRQPTADGNREQTVRARGGRPSCIAGAT